MTSFDAYPRVIALLVILGSACAREDGSPPARQMPAGAPAAIEADPFLSIGAETGDTLRELYRVITPFLDTGGRLVIPLAGAHTVRIFGADRSFVASLGRAGEGPGEFQSIDAAWSRGDTIEVFDSRLRRITRFLPDGQIDVVTLDRSVPVQGAVPGAIPGGWILNRVARREEPKSVAAQVSGRDDIVIHQFARDGSHLGEIARTEGIARYDVPGWSGPEPLSPRAVMRIHGGFVYIGETLTTMLRVLEPNGSVRMEAGWESEEPESIVAAVRSVIDAAVAQAPTDRADETRHRLEAAAVPERLSAWWDFVVDSEGFIWIRPFDPLLHAVALGGLGPGSYLLSGNGYGGRWLIVSPSGGRVGEIELPAKLSPVQITNDALVGIRRDSLGVESVEVYRLARE